MSGESEDTQVVDSNSVEVVAEEPLTDGTALASRGNRSAAKRMTKEEVREAAITDFVKSDPVSQSITSGEQPLIRLRRIQHEITREASVIEFERIETGRAGKPMSMLAMRRIEALSRLATIELKIRELDQQAVSLSSEKMQKLFDFWSLKVLEAGRATMPEEMLKLFLNKWGSSMEHWEEEAQNVLR